MIDECDRIEYRANRRIVDDDRTTSKMLSKRRTRKKEKTIDATDLVRVDYWTIVDVRLTDATNRRHEIKRYQKHCQREVSGALDIRATSTTIRDPAREWESSGWGGGWSRGGTRWTEEG